jgi:hypothetical protein
VERSGLSSVGRSYYVMRGLLLVPMGVVFAAAGVLDWPPFGSEPDNGNAVWFLLVLALAAAGYVAVDRWYAATWGRVQPPRGTEVRIGLVTLVVALVMGLAISADIRWDLPVSLFGLVFAVGGLGYYRLVVGLRPYHWGTYGLVGLLCLLPIWGGVGDTVSAALVPIGLATIAVGLFDHRELVRTRDRVREAVTLGGARGRP